MEYHIDNPFPTSTQEKRVLISRLVSQAWKSIPEEVFVRGFVKSGIVPTGPRDSYGRFRVANVKETEAPVVCNDN